MPSKAYPHPEERPRSLHQARTGGASRRTQDRDAALRLDSCPAAPLCPSYSLSGTPASSSSSQTFAVASEGARQSPRGDNDPPDEIFGALGKAERLNWLSSKKR